MDVAENARQLVDIIAKLQYLAAELEKAAKKRKKP